MSVSTESLWNEFRERLKLFVRRRVADEQAANDVLQLAFLRMHQSLIAGKGPDDPSAWVFAITRNALSDYYRVESSQASRAKALSNQEPATVNGTAIANNTETSVAENLSECVEPMLRGLQSPYREALVMTVLQGMTQEEAASRVGISLSGMKSRVQRGRGKLRNLFEACCKIELDVRGKPIDVEKREEDCLCEPSGSGTDRE